MDTTRPIVIGTTGGTEVLGIATSPIKGVVLVFCGLTINPITCGRDARFTIP